MTRTATQDEYGVMTEPTTLTLTRMLPGPAERVWDYLTKSDLRRQWLASGEMEMRPGAAFTLTWRNDELGDDPSARPEGFPEEHSLESRVIACDPPRRLVFAWGEGDVTFALEPRGEQVRLTLTHRRVSGRAMLLNVSAGWHAHLNLLAARLNDRPTTGFWPEWRRLKGQYEGRVGE